MGSVKSIALAGAVVLTAGAAQAADLPQMMPPPMHYQPVVEEFRGWYLRGDIGMSNQQVNSLFNVLYDTVDNVNTIHKEFSSAPIFGIGFGYQFNSWLRADVTGEYRGKSTFHGLDIVRAGGGVFTDEYRAFKSEWLLLANVYADLGTWGGFTPFLGVGLGGAQVTITDFLDVCTTCPGGVATGATTSKFNFAWAVHAGIGYKVTPNVTIEFAYRYLDLGDAVTGDLVTYDGQNNVNNPMHFKGITSHDFKLGVRWMFDSPKEYYPQKDPYYPPLMRRG